MNKLTFTRLLVIIVIILFAIWLMSCEDPYEQELEKKYYCIEAKIKAIDYTIDKHCILIERYGGGKNRYPEEHRVYQTWRNGMVILGMDQQVMNKVTSCNECK